MKKSKVENMPLEKFIELLKELKCEQVVIGTSGQPSKTFQMSPESLKNERTN